MRSSVYARTLTASPMSNCDGSGLRLTNEEPHLYPIYVHCFRDDSGRWTEAFSGN